MKYTDLLMTGLRSLVENLGIHIDVVCHLRKSSVDGKGFENGAKITLDDLRGSGTLKQIPNMIFALERDQQQAAGDRICTVRGLKDRFAGQAYGELGYLLYDHETGWLKEVAAPAEDVRVSGFADQARVLSETMPGPTREF